MKRRFVINRAQDNGPTPERAAKGDFGWVGEDEGKKTDVRSRNKVVANMLNAGDITQEAVNAADRWYRDYCLAYQAGYTLSRVNGEASYQTRSKEDDDGMGRHDAVSFSVVRGKAAVRVSEVRSALGVCAEVRLKAMLIDELNFTKMGALFFPGLPRNNATPHIKAQCMMVLEQLSSFYLLRQKEGSSLRRNELPCQTEYA